MKKFLLSLLLFCLVLLGVNFFFFKILEKHYWEDYKKVNTNFSTHLLADSHGLSLDNFLEREGIYNFSAGSDSYTDMHQKIKFLIRNGKLDTLIISADDHMLSPYRERMNNYDRSVYFSNKDDFKNIYTFLKSRVIKYWIVFLNPKGRTILKEFFIARISGVFKGDKSLSKENEEMWMHFDEATKIRKATNRRDLQFFESTPSKSLKTELEKIITTCNLNNIHLIGLKFPLAEEYIEVLNGKNYGADSILRANNIKVIDNTSIYMDSIHYFGNQDHLNPLGGRQFAKDLMLRVRN